jgi:hypothetical protein
MASGHDQIHEGMEVLGADQQRVGQVIEVRASDFVIERPQQRAVAVPFGAIGDVTAHQVVLTISADHVDSIKWPQQPRDETAGQSAAADRGSDDTIML